MNQALACVVIATQIIEMLNMKSTDVASTGFSKARLRTRGLRGHTGRRTCVPTTLTALGKVGGSDAMENWPPHKMMELERGTVNLLTVESVSARLGWSMRAVNESPTAMFEVIEDNHVSNSMQDTPWILPAKFSGVAAECQT